MCFYPLLDGGLGSSPQVRGRLSCRESRTCSSGLIPAGAGQTVGAVQAMCRLRAHPRRCGADCGGPTRRRRGPGLIPAGAGQTDTAQRPAHPRRAHPRRCGADRGPLARLLTCWGSSPQVRGRLHRASGSAFVDGLIPAGAGQTAQALKRSGAARAHPRRCGADRGLRDLQRRFRGLIPAGAGQTVARVVALGGVWAHPRRCGADLAGIGDDLVNMGSSPQVRGRRELEVIYRVRTGLIPAGAGQTIIASSSRVACRAHPRRCGADHRPHHCGAGRGGSSPQVRGRRERR